MKPRYPTRNGIAIPLNEIWLPETGLPDEPEYKNRHHMCWTERAFGKYAILMCLRNLEHQQHLIPIDTHAYIHAKYEPPRIPTPQQAMSEIERAKDNGETMSMRQGGGWIKREIGNDILKLCVDNYSQLTHKTDW